MSSEIQSSHSNKSSAFVCMIWTVYLSRPKVNWADDCRGRHGTVSMNLWYGSSCTLTAFKFVVVGKWYRSAPIKHSQMATPINLILVNDLKPVSNAVVVCYYMSLHAMNQLRLHHSMDCTICQQCLWLNRILKMPGPLPPFKSSVQCRQFVLDVFLWDLTKNNKVWFMTQLLRKLERPAFD